jgi:uncharacterized coiled-coil protein SlyX
VVEQKKQSSTSLLEFRLNALIGAVNRGVDRLSGVLDDRLTDIADVLDDPASGQDNEAIFDLLVTLDNRLERIQIDMATQEERLQALGAALTNVQAGVDRIQASLEALKADNPALEDEITAIEAQVGALGADVAEVVPEPEPEPTPEPAPEGGSTEG